MHKILTTFGLIAMLALLGCAAQPDTTDPGGAGPTTGHSGGNGDAEPVAEPEGDNTEKPAPTADLPKRVFQFTYTANIPKPAEGTKKLRIWAPLPRAEAGVQEVSDLRIISPANARQTESADYGNRFLYAEIDNPTAGVKVEWTAKITRYEDRGQGTGAQNPRYTKGVKLIDIDGSASGQATALVTKLKLTEEGLSDTDCAKRIYDDVLGEMEYNKKVAGYGHGDFIRSIEVCKGNCTDFHARFMGVGRKAGLPVRFTMGIPMKPGKTSYNSYHCWAHWYDKASDTWKPVDISEADKVVAKAPGKAEWFFGNIGKNRITLTYGRDLTLEPAQAGPPLNYMVFPYAEADGKGVPMSKKDWLWTWKDAE